MSGVGAEPAGNKEFGLQGSVCDGNARANRSASEAMMMVGL